MSSATSIKMRINNAEQFLESVSEPAFTTLYITYGKVDSWANDSSPDVANTSTAAENEVWYNMIGGKKLYGNDLCLVIPRYDWTTNTSYYSFDHMATDLYDKNFYVLTEDYNVYKCLSNNNGVVSTVKPTAVNPASVTQTSDGYVWKYLYSISSSDQLRFTTTNYIPVKRVSTDNGSLQWRVQESTVEGAIYDIKIANTGSGYTNSSNILVTISGDGSSATATATLNTISGKVSTITLTDYGEGYTYANVAITGGGGQDATARAIMSPAGGHGMDAIYELGGSKVMLNPFLRFTEGDILPATNDYRQIAIIKDPLISNGAYIASNSVFQQTYTLSTTGSGNYYQDEIVYQGAALAGSSFSGRIVSWDSANGVAVIINISGTPSGQSLIGSLSSTSRFVSKIVTQDLKNRSGQILYINNSKAITRSSDQTEDFKIVLKF